MEILKVSRIVGRRKFYNCKCHCGNIIECRSDYIKKSCGCDRLYKNMKPHIDSQWKFIEQPTIQKEKVKCQCACGAIEYKYPEAIITGKSKRCTKCRDRARIDINYLDIGGIAKHPLYKVLDGMKQRCNNKSSKSYRWYGLKGVKVCNEWENSFHSFIQWGITNGYCKGMTIDRIDPNGNYEPNNCRFISMTEQSENKIIQNNNTSGYAGVSFNKKMNMYESYYSYNYIKVRVGYYHTSLEAHIKREEALRVNQINYKRVNKC